MVERPRDFTGAQRDAGISYSDAGDYLNGARDELEKMLADTNRFDNATKFGVAGGGAGAAISTIFRSSTDQILGFLTFMGVSYGTNQLVDPKTVTDIYSAGLKNLLCIERAGSDADSAFKLVTNDGKALVIARDALQQDVDDARNSANPGRYTTLVDRANADIDRARDVLAEIDKYRASAKIGERMVGAVDSTILAVNDQIRAKAASIDAFAQFGSFITTSINNGTALRSQINSAVKQLQAAAKSQATADELQRRFAKHTADLEAVLAAIPKHLDMTSATAIGGCSVQFPADTPVTVSPAGPIELNAGDQTRVAVSGGKGPYSVPRFSGPDPSKDVDIVATRNDVSGAEFQFSAHANAGTGNYTFHFADATGKNSPDVQLNVHAKAAVKPTAITANTTTGGAPGVAARPKIDKVQLLIDTNGGITKVDDILGLPQIVKSPADKAFTTRVSNLQTCVLKMDKPDGVLTQALLNETPKDTTGCVKKAEDSEKAAPAAAAGHGPPPSPTHAPAQQ
jgi:hypothetical protein